MKISAGALGLVVSFAMVHGGLAAKKPSKISEFAGGYNGSVVYASIVTGPTTAIFSASKKKDVGTLTLTSTLNIGGEVATLVETIGINKRSVAYSLTIGTTSVSGVGTVTVGKKSINYTVTAMSGDTTYVVTGVIVKTGKRSMTVNVTYSGGGNPFTIIYSLSKRGK